MSNHLYNTHNAEADIFFQLNVHLLETPGATQDTWLIDIGRMQVTA